MSIDNLTPTNRPDILATWLAGRSEATVRAYRAAVADFTSSSSSLSLQSFLGHSQAEATRSVFDWRAAMLERDLAPATINARLAAVRSLTKLARMLGVIDWTVELPNVRAESYRDTRGPGMDGVRAVILAAGRQRSEWKAARDVAIIRLMFDLGLRRSSVVSLDYHHVDFATDVIHVAVKGSHYRKIRSLPRKTKQVILRWLDERGHEPGPLFLNRGGGRISGRSVHRMLRGLHGPNPHGLRHTAITAALDMTNGDVRQVQHFSGHSDVRVIQLYDDRRKDVDGRISDIISEEV